MPAWQLWRCTTGVFGRYLILLSCEDSLRAYPRAAVQRRLACRGCSLCMQTPWLFSSLVALVSYLSLVPQFTGLFTCVVDRDLLVLFSLHTPALLVSRRRTAGLHCCMHHPSVSCQLPAPNASSGHATWCASYACVHTSCLVVWWCFVSPAAAAVMQWDK